MKEFILEVPAGTKVEIREYDNCHTITMYEKPQPIIVHDLLLSEEELIQNDDLINEEAITNA